MAARKNSDELIEAIDESRRDLIKKILLGGTVAYVAPVIASFHLNPSTVLASDGLASGSNMSQAFGSNMSQPLGSNMRMASHPLGSNQRQRA